MIIILSSIIIMVLVYQEYPEEAGWMKKNKMLIKGNWNSKIFLINSGVYLVALREINQLENIYINIYIYDKK